jgi:Sec-independent protein translocase protein TatA
MFGIGTGELIVLALIAAIALRRRLPSAIERLRSSITRFTDELAERREQIKNQPKRVDYVELVTASRDSSMKERFKKFMWSPAFCAILGVVGCATGFYFQGVAANGSGLWCLGLIFLGAAYLDKNP